MKKLFVLLLWFVFLLTACAPVAAPTAESESPAAGDSASPMDTPAPTAIARSKMEATDPKTVTLASGEIQLLEFFAFWCGTCRSIAPIVHELEAEYSGKVKFVYLDVDDPRNDAFKQVLDFRYQPYLVLLDGDGNVLQQWVGAITAEDLRPALDAAQ